MFNKKVLTSVAAALMLAVTAAPISTYAAEGSTAQEEQAQMATPVLTEPVVENTNTIHLTISEISSFEVTKDGQRIDQAYWYVLDPNTGLYNATVRVSGTLVAGDTLNVTAVAENRTPSAPLVITVQQVQPAPELEATATPQLESNLKEGGNDFTISTAEQATIQVQKAGQIVSMYYTVSYSDAENRYVYNLHLYSPAAAGEVYTVTAQEDGMKVSEPLEVECVSVK